MKLLHSLWFALESQFFDKTQFNVMLSKSEILLSVLDGLIIKYSW